MHNQWAVLLCPAGIVDKWLAHRVGQNRIYALYMTVYLVEPLSIIPDIHRIYFVLANLLAQ